MEELVSKYPLLDRIRRWYLIGRSFDLIRSPDVNDESAFGLMRTLEEELKKEIG